MKILVTGGLGFIGSHTSLLLLEEGYDVVILDNLSNSRISTLEKINSLSANKAAFVQGDILDEKIVDKVFSLGNFHGVIHFAALKSVEESQNNPMKYYLNNVAGTLTILKECQKYGVRNFVFSSSASVYGDAESPVSEDTTPGKRLNPYAESKGMCERILNDIAISNNSMRPTILRYFNVIGAHRSGLLGEESTKEFGNIMPYIVKVASGKMDKILVYGNDYNTPDGTGIRDYIHVMDVAKAHVRALEKQREGCQTYNLGTGQGTSVFELIETFEEVSGLKIPYEVAQRRYGDIEVSYSNPAKAMGELGWKAEFDIRDMVRDTWNYEKLRFKY